VVSSCAREGRTQGITQQQKTADCRRAFPSDSIRPKQKELRPVAKQTLKTLCEGALKNSVCVQRYRISREDAKRVQEAEKRSHDEALRLLLKIIFKV